RFIVEVPPNPTVEKLVGIQGEAQNRNGPYQNLRPELCSLNFPRTYELEPFTTAYPETFDLGAVVDGIRTTSGQEQGKTASHAQYPDLPFVQTGGSQPARPQEDAQGQEKHPDGHQSAEQSQDKEQAH